MIERVLVVDDEPLARERVLRLLRRVAPNASVHEAADGVSAVVSIQSLRPDAVLLDIEMPARNGLEVVSTSGCERMPPTIVITAYDEHAVAAFEVAAIDYLLKPFDDQRFETAWRRLEQRCAAGLFAGEARRLQEVLAALVGSAGDYPEANRERFVIREGGRTVIVPLADIEWIESSGNHVVLHGARGSHRVRDTLSAVASRLDPARFVRIHRRFIIDVAAMRELRPWSGGDQLIVLQGGAKLPVSRNYRHDLARRLASRS
jgi:two-component system LytT family response regulator